MSLDVDLALVPTVGHETSDSPLRFVVSSTSNRNFLASAVVDFGMDGSTFSVEVGDVERIGGADGNLTKPAIARAIAEYVSRAICLQLEHPHSPNSVVQEMQASENRTLH